MLVLLELEIPAKAGSKGESKTEPMCTQGSLTL